MSLNYTDEEVYKKIGERIVELRKSRGLRQIDLASRTGMEDSAIRRLEKGKTNPTVKTLLTVAEALSVSLADLFKY